MPITRKRRDEQSDTNDEANGEATFTCFIHRARWFVVSQTEGQELPAVPIPQWTAEQALVNLNIERVVFDSTDGNIQGFARGRQIAINPVAQLPHKTLFHEAAHVLLHINEGNFTDSELTPRSLREVEAEAVALLCCESLGLDGARYCRGYVQHWLSQKTGSDASAIPEKSAQKIFRVADQIVRAGRTRPEQAGVVE